jgi:hypothetical protein
MFEKYLNLIQDHNKKRDEIRVFLDNLNLKQLDFNIDGDIINFSIPSAFKLRVTQNKEAISLFLKERGLKPKNL